MRKLKCTEVRHLCKLLAKDSHVVLSGFNFRFCAILGHSPILLSCHEPDVSLGTGAAPISKKWFLALKELQDQSTYVVLYSRQLGSD